LNQLPHPYKKSSFFLSHRLVNANSHPREFVYVLLCGGGVLFVTKERSQLSLKGIFSFPEPGGDLKILSCTFFSVILR
jgi:hypothetical protein